MSIIDFHSHIIPGVDDGSRSVEESLDMLRMIADGGIKTVAATPHFYATHDSPQRFFARRERALKALRASVRDGMPTILAGAEVAFFEGMPECDELRDMTIEGTGLLLVEMPGRTWTRRMFRELIRLADKQGVTPLLAHIDRYSPNSKMLELVDEFVAEGGMVQANADFFLGMFTFRRGIRMIEKNRIHLLGSDCHGASFRAPNLAKAIRRIEDKCGPEPLAMIEAAQERIPIPTHAQNT